MIYDSMIYFFNLNNNIELYSYALYNIYKYISKFRGDVLLSLQVDVTLLDRTQ